MMFTLGSGVKLSLIVFLLIQPIPATRPVIVAASRIDFTSLLSDIVLCIYNTFKFDFDFRFHRHALIRTPQSHPFLPVHRDHELHR